MGLAVVDSVTKNRLSSEKLRRHWMSSPLGTKDEKLRKGEKSWINTSCSVGTNALSFVKPSIDSANKLWAEFAT